MTIRELRNRLSFWQSVLNLSEWSITVKFGTAADMTDETGHRCQGLNYIDVETLSSEILIDRSNDERESTLVHELLHLVYDGHKEQDGSYDALHERAINRTAAALMKLAFPAE